MTGWRQPAGNAGPACSWAFWAPGTQCIHKQEVNSSSNMQPCELCTVTWATTPAIGTRVDRRRWWLTAHNRIVIKVGKHLATSAMKSLTLLCCRHLQCGFQPYDSSYACNRQAGATQFVCMYANCHMTRDAKQTLPTNAKPGAQNTSHCSLMQHASRPRSSPRPAFQAKPTQTVLAACIMGYTLDSSTQLHPCWFGHPHSSCMLLYTLPCVERALGSV